MDNDRPKEGTQSPAAPLLCGLAVWLCERESRQLRRHNCEYYTCQEYRHPYWVTVAHGRSLAECLTRLAAHNTGTLAPERSDGRQE